MFTLKCGWKSVQESGIFFFFISDAVKWDHKQGKTKASPFPLGYLLTAKYLHSHMRRYGCKLPFRCMYARTAEIINSYFKHHLSVLYKDCMNVINHCILSETCVQRCVYFMLFKKKKKNVCVGGREWVHDCDLTLTFWHFPHTSAMSWQPKTLW